MRVSPGIWPKPAVDATHYEGERTSKNGEFVDEVAKTNILRDDNRAVMPAIAHFLEDGFKARDKQGKLLLPDLSALLSRAIGIFSDYGGEDASSRYSTLSDEFGQYELYLKCESCLHERRTTPHLLASFCGWDAKLTDVVRRLRCSICGQKKCAARTAPMSVPRGYKSH
jgi:hypothetical protein